MKKLLCVMLIFAALGVTAFADTTFDASLYTKEELREILTQIYLQIPASEGDVLLFDQDGIQVVYCNIKATGSFWRINLMVTNNTDNSVSVSVNKLKGNRAQLGIWDNGNTVDGQSVYLSAPNNDFGIERSAMLEYGIETLKTLDFELKIYFTESKESVTVPVHLDVDYPVK